MIISKKANTDTTYCINNTCTDKCWRHISNWEFEADKNYCFTSGLENCENIEDDYLVKEMENTNE